MSIDDVRPAELVSGGRARPGSVPDPEVSQTEIGVSPIFTHVLPDCAGLNARLRRVILDRMVISPGLKKSNCGGWQSERNLQLWDDPAIGILLERIQAMLRSVVRQTVDDPGDELLRDWDVEAWANVNQLGDTVAAHTHSGGVNMWAAIYYVDTGESGDTVSSGFTRFMDMGGTPRPVGNHARPADGLKTPRVSMERQERCAEPEWYGDHDLQLQPVAGKMVMFPATLPHYVTSYLGTGKRITIAMNLRHTKFVVADFENPYSRRRELWRNYRSVMLAMYEGKRMTREALASVVPVDTWPAGLRSKLLGGGD